LLRTIGLTKRYGQVTVLENVDIEVRPGEIHALLGANGAGKSTLCKIISGLIPASRGDMELDGVPYRPSHKQSAEAAGVEIVQQELNLIANLSVAENLHLTRLPNTLGIVRGRRLRESARRVLDRFGLSGIPVDTPVGSLGVGRQQMVEIAASLARRCKLLILDEPTAALSGSESAALFDQLHRLRRQQVGIIYISHRLEEVRSISDRITILRDGKGVGTFATESLTTDDMVQRMSGEAASSAEPTHTSHRTSEIAMRVAGLTCGMVRDVSFDVHRGERFGITGLVGSGRTEVLRGVFGADVATAGQVTLSRSGATTTFTSPSRAVDAGLAMVTEDRKQNGLLLSQSIRVNTTLAALARRFSSAGLIRRKSETEETESMRRFMAIHSQGIEQSAGSLSGGNQQKVAIAKWLTQDADVFLFDEPTRGIDVASRRRIYQLFESLAARGKALVIVSSDLDELFETCDRIAVMSAGRLVTTSNRTGFDRDSLLQASFSGYSS